MNIYLKFKVDFDENTKYVYIKMIRSSGVPKGRLQSVEVVAESRVKVWPWSGLFGINRKIAAKMRKMLSDYFKNRTRNAAFVKSCSDFSREEYNIRDQKTIDFLRKKGIKIL